jgi:hypothetical protein
LSSAHAFLDALESDHNPDEEGDDRPRDDDGEGGLWQRREAADQPEAAQHDEDDDQKYGWGGPVSTPVTALSFTISLAAALAAGIIGQAVGNLLQGSAMTFLSWTMMSGTSAANLLLAGPLMIILAAQTMLVAAWATYVVFRVVGLRQAPG